MAEILRYSLTNPYRLPDGYTPIAYIESTGGEYIDTGILAKSTILSLLDFQFTNNPTNQTRLLGAISNSTYYCIYIGDNGANLKCYTKQTGTYSVLETRNLLRHTILYNRSSDHSIYLDGVKKYTYTTSTKQSTSNILLFDEEGYNIANSINIKMKLYKCKIWDGDTILRDFIPCTNSSDVPGLFDIVNLQFYSSATDTAFKAGPEVRILPLEYLLVEYLESSGTQWINTAYTCNSTTTPTLKYKLDAMALSSAVGNKWWSNGIGGGSGITFHVGIGNGSNSSYPFTYGDGVTDRITSVYGSLNTKYIWELDMVNSTYKVWDNTGTILVNITANKQTPTLSLNLTLFRWYSYTKTGYCFGMRIYNMLLSSSSTLVRDLVPCYRRSDMKPGMYDLVNNVFYTNAGTGEFILGPTIEESSRLLEYNNISSDYIGTPTNLSSSTENPNGEISYLGSTYFNNSYIGLLNLPTFTNISISCWIKPSNTSTNLALLNYRSDIGKDLALFLVGGNIRLDVGNNTTVFSNYKYTTNWQHIVATYNGSAKCLYINGELKLSISLTTAISCSVTKGTIGMSSTDTITGNNTNVYSGLLYDFRIFDTALTADEIEAIYKMK